MPGMGGAPIRIHLLGRFSVEVRGARLECGRKVPRRPLELLQYLAAHAGQELPEAEVAGALWPGRASTLAVRALSVTVHRLRRLLGAPEAIVRRGGRIALSTGHAWCDAAEFERILDSADRCARKGERRAMAARALELYAGDFLAGEPRRPWAAPIRARLRHRFVQALAPREAHAAPLESVTDL